MWFEPKKRAVYAFPSYQVQLSVLYNDSINPISKIDMPAVTLWIAIPFAIVVEGVAWLLPIFLLVIDTGFVAFLKHEHAVVRLQSGRQELVLDGRRLGWEAGAEAQIGDVTAGVLVASSNEVTRFSRQGLADFLRDGTTIHGGHLPACITEEVAESSPVKVVHLDDVGYGISGKKRERSKGEEGSDAHVCKKRMITPEFLWALTEEIFIKVNLLYAKGFQKLTLKTCNICKAGWALW